MRARTGRLRPRRCTFASLLVVGLGLASPVGQAAAERPRCRLEQAALTDGGLRALVTQVDLQGRLMRDARFELELGAAETARPTARRPLLPREKKLCFVLLVEGSAAYAPATDAVRAALRSFLAALPPDSQGELWRFGNQVDAPHGFKPLPHLMGLVDRYSATDEGELQLVKAVRQGLTALSDSAEADTRRVLVVLADGFNPVMDRQLFQAVGQELARREVPLFPVAFSPRDVRGPLRNLGELAKHSAGTLRWAQTLGELEPQFLALARELLAAEVLTFDSRVVRKLGSGQTSLRVTCGEGHSNFCLLAVPARRRVAPWLGLAALSAAVAAAVIGVIWRRRKRATAAAGTAVHSGPGLVGGSGSVRGQKVRLQEQLLVGIGLAGPGTWTLASGPAEPLCELRKERDGHYVITAHRGRCRVFLNGRVLLGTVTLQHGDRVQVEDQAEFTFHDRLDQDPASLH